MTDLLSLVQAFAEKSIAVSIVIVLGGMYLFIKASVDIIMTTNSRFDQLDAKMDARSVETTNTMKNEVTRIHTHLSTTDQLSLTMALALMQVVPDKTFQSTVSAAIQKMQNRGNNYGEPDS